MPVVINEFEVVSEAVPLVRRSDSNGAAPAAERKAGESRVTVQELRLLDLKSLRVWAH
jgi:hypothetical protein